MRQISLYLLLVVVLLYAMGLLMVFNTTSAEVLNKSLPKSPSYAFLKQILFGLMSLAIGLATLSLGYKKIIHYSPWFLAIATLFLILVIIPGVGHQINGARRWIGYGAVSFQPSEFVKLLIPIYFIRLKDQNETLSYKNFLFHMAILAVPLFLILIEPDNGTVAIILVALLALFFLTKLRALYWALPMGILLVAGGIVAANMPHVSDRIAIYMHPEQDLLGKGHQPYQAKIAAGSGGVFGKGLAKSLQKYDYLPEARSDYIAAIFAEEFGFMGTTLLILAYMTLGFIGLMIAQRAKSREGFYLAAIITFLLCFQAFLNLGVVSGLLPSKGINLPFFSQGGTSLMMGAMAIALLIQIANEGKNEKKAW